MRYFCFWGFSLFGCFGFFFAWGKVSCYLYFCQLVCQNNSVALQKVLPDIHCHHITTFNSLLRNHLSGASFLTLSYYFECSHTVCIGYICRSILSQIRSMLWKQNSQLSPCFGLYCRGISKHSDLITLNQKMRSMSIPFAVPQPQSVQLMESNQSYPKIKFSTCVLCQCWVLSSNCFVLQIHSYCSAFLADVSLVMDKHNALKGCYSWPLYLLQIKQYSYSSLN